MFEITVIALVLGLGSIIVIGSIALIALLEVTRESSK